MGAAYAKRGLLTTEAAACGFFHVGLGIVSDRRGRGRVALRTAGKVPALRLTAAARSLACCGLLRICFELAQRCHGGCGGVFALAVFLAAFGFADVMILSHGISRSDRRLETPVPDQFTRQRALSLEEAMEIEHGR